MKWTYLLFLMALGGLSCNATKEGAFDPQFFVGKWKHETKNSFEVWSLDGAGNLTGYSSSIKNGEETIWESLSIKKREKGWVYTATVANQNDGAAIPFQFNKEVKGLYSFENLEHDFPKKIQYHKIAQDTLKVVVLGDNDEGFSFRQVRQIP